MSKNTPNWVTFHDLEFEEKRNCIRSINYEFSICGTAWVEPHETMLVLEYDPEVMPCKTCLKLVEFCKSLKMPRRIK